MKTSQSHSATLVGWTWHVVAVIRRAAETIAPSKMQRLCVLQVRRASPLLRLVARESFSSSASTASEEQTTRLASLRDVRGVLRLSGPNLLHFLQGLITNDATALEVPDAKPLFAWILTPQGRYAHDLLFYREAGPEPSLLVDTDRKGKEDLISLLKRYRMHQRSIDIRDVSNSHSVWVRFGAGALPAPTGRWHQDPRLPELGLRTVLPDLEAGSGSRGGREEEVPWREYRRWRILQGVAEGDSEIPSGAAIPAEYNLDALNGVSFSKGCYVGQEFMARIHFKGVVRKRLMPFRVDHASPSACCLDPGSQVCDVYDAAGALESVGTVRAREGGVGLALLRLKSGLSAAQNNEPLYVGCGAAGQYVNIQPWRPSWWNPEWGNTPQEWGPEE